VPPGLRKWSSPKLGPGPTILPPAVRGVVRFHDQTESSDPLPASLARKSHSKSQRGAASGGISRRGATVCAVQVLSEPCRATPGDAREVTGVKGSPVQIRPSRPEGPGQKGFRVLTRAPFRSSGSQTGSLDASQMSQVSQSSHHSMPLHLAQLDDRLHERAPAGVGQCVRQESI
jgi:hypothetical protein